MLIGMNEFIFLAQSLLVAFFALGAIFFGLGGLTSLVTLCALLSNVFVRKQTTLFGLDVVTCDALAIGSDLAIHLIYEYYGKKEAQRAISLCLYLTLFFLVMAQLFLWYQPNIYDVTQAEYVAVLAPLPWIMGTSCLVALVTKILNLSLYHMFSTWWPNRRFFTKTILALTISQLFDTIAFTLIALSGTVHSVVQIIVFCYTIKCIVIFSGIPLVTFCRKFLPFKPYNDSFTAPGSPTPGWGRRK